MTNSNKKSFTFSEYQELFTLAKKHYNFAAFQNYQNYDQCLFLRHDLDFSIHAAWRLAQIENQLDIQATYFVHLHSKFYNVFEDVTYHKLNDIIQMNHHIGIHFHPGFYSAQRDWMRHLMNEKATLENLLNISIHSFSFHNPTKEQITFGKDIQGMTNTYNSYFQNEVDYISDSNGLWKHRSLHEILMSSKRPKKLQVLIHPGWWTEEHITSPQERLVRLVEGRANHVKNHLKKNQFYR